MTALIQNFSIPADNDIAVDLQVSPDLELETLESTTIFWNAYPQAFGVPDLGAGPLISKTTEDGTIILLPSPDTMKCQIKIQRTDTTELLRNYYHETYLLDVIGNKSTLNIGIMTVT